MPYTYADALGLAFGRRPFTVAEVRTRLGAPRAARTLHELKARGVVERIGRGSYRLLAPDERPDLRHAEWHRVRDALLAAPYAKAWVGPSAVETWTRGRYRIGPSPFLRVFHLGIHPDDHDAWIAYLKDHDVPMGRKHIGVRIELVPIDPAAPLDAIDGEPVIDKETVRQLIRDHPALYGDAEALLDGSR